MHSLQEILETKKTVYHLEGSDESSIKLAEEKLGLSFATDFIDYLKQYSLLSYEAHELTGLSKSTRLNVVDATLREKTENDYIGDDMYLIESIGVENLTIWQNSCGEIFEVAYKQKPRKIFDSLLEYIESA